MMIRIDKEKDDVQRVLRKLNRKAPHLAYNIRDKVGFEVVKVSQRDYLSGQALKAPTGTLRRSITHKSDSRKTTVGTNVVYGPIHEYGGTIKAKNAPYLHFKVNAQWVKVQSVRIPKRPFLGWEAALGDVVNGRRGMEIAEKEIEKWKKKNWR